MHATRKIQGLVTSPILIPSHITITSPELTIRVPGVRLEHASKLPQSLQKLSDMQPTLAKQDISAPNDLEPQITPTGASPIRPDAMLAR